MTIFLATVIVALSQAAPPGKPDKAAFLDLIEAAYSPIEDISFEYEGRLVYNTRLARERLKLGDDGVYISYSGSFAWRHDGAMMVDAYQRTQSTNQIVRNQVAAIGQKYEEENRANDLPVGGGLITDRRSQNLMRVGFPTNFCLFPDFIWYVKSGDQEFNELGNESIQGHRCKVVEFSDRGSDRMNNHSQFTGHRVWIDLGRGCHPVRREIYMGGQLASRTSISLEQFTLPSGGPIWLPSEAIIDGFVEVDDARKVYYAKEPQNTEFFRVMMNTVKLNTALRDTQFSVRFRRGTPITDNLRNLKYEYGLQRHTSATRVEAEAQLQEQLKKAEEQKDELIASSWSRQGAGWSEYAPWLIGVVALSAACWALYTGRRRV